LQVSRWDEILNKRVAFAKALKLSPEFAEKLLELIHSESIRKQTEIMNKDKEGQAQEKLTHA
jgi:chorismate mutase